MEATSSNDSRSVASRARTPLLGWLREGTPAARRGLLAASLGWGLDGVLPALLTLWIRRGVEESGVWLEAQRSRGSPSSATVRDVFRGRFAATTALLTILSTSTIFAYWGLNLWVPAYLSLPGRSAAGSG